MGFGRLAWDSVTTAGNIGIYAGKKAFGAGKKVVNSVTSTVKGVSETVDNLKKFKNSDSFERGRILADSYYKGGTIKKVVNGAKQMGNAVRTGVKLPFIPIVAANKGITAMQNGYDAFKGGLKKYQGSSDAVKAATTIGVGYGAYKLDGALQDRAAEQAEQAMNSISYKNASINLDKKEMYVNDTSTTNIPIDTSTPSSNSPEDYADYYDYQEWATTKGNNYPEREETEVTMFDNPRKVAHILGANIYLVNAIDEYLGNRRKLASVTENGIKYTNNEYKRGSKLLAAAVIGGAVALPTMALNSSVYSGEALEPWHPEYYRL